MNPIQSALIGDINAAKQKLQEASAILSGVAASAQAKGSPTVKADCDAAKAAVDQHLAALGKDYSLLSEFGAIV